MCFYSAVGESVGSILAPTQVGGAGGWSILSAGGTGGAGGGGLQILIKHHAQIDGLYEIMVYLDFDKLK